MKKSFLLLIVFVYTSVFAQRNPKFDTKDILAQSFAIESCDFDPEAHAMIVFKETSHDLILSSNLLNLKIATRKVIKILDEEGFDYANLEYQYTHAKNFEKFKIDKAVIYNQNEAGQYIPEEIQKNHIYNTKVSEEHTKTSVSVPNVKVGSIIYYEYSLETSYLPYFYFQEAIPVLKSVFRASYEPEFTLNFYPDIWQHFEKFNEARGGRVEEVYIIDSVRGLDREPFMLSSYLYRQKITTQAISYDNHSQNIHVPLRKEWSVVVGELAANDYFGKKYKSDVKDAAPLIKEARSLADSMERLKLIYNYIQKNFALTDEEDIYTTASLTEIWRSHKGTQGGLQLLFARLLESAGLSPAICLTTTNREEMLDERRPSSQWFSKVLVMININGENLYLDPTYSNIPYYLTPRSYFYSTSLVLPNLTKPKPVFYFDKVFPPNQSYKEDIFISGNINGKGTLEGHAQYSSFDYARAYKTYDYQNDSANFFMQLRSHGFLQFKDRKVALDSLEKKPMTIDIDFELPLHKQDNFYFLPINLFNQFNENPFQKEIRMSGVYFGYTQKVKLNYNFFIDPALTVDHTPQNIKIVMPDNSIILTRRSQVVGNNLQMLIQLDFNKIYYPVEEYQEFKEFFKLFIQKLQEEITLKEI